jgi:hypothetical protein
MPAITGKNRDYGDYDLNTFPSAFYGSVHVVVRRQANGSPELDECVERDAVADISPQDARRFAAALIEAADDAERCAG